MNKNYFTLLLIILCCFVYSCSGTDSQVTAPDSSGRITSAEPPSKTACLGLWQVSIDPASGKVDAAELRSSDYIINVLGFLEPPPLNQLTIDFNTLQIDGQNSKISVDVILKHPIPDPTFTGFDVRGVVFGPEVANADGLTPVMAPKYFANQQFGYIDGLLGTPNSKANYHDDISGYKYFCDGLGLDDDLAAFFSKPANLAKHGSFPNGKILKRHYELEWAGSDYAFFVFNYAVYANYNWPVGEPPIDLSDFETSAANSQEAVCCKVTELANSLHYSGGSGGGSISLDVEIWDWQGNIRDVTVASLDGTTIPEVKINQSASGSTEYSYLYEFSDVQGAPKAEGPLDILITATDPLTFGQSWFLGLLKKTNQLYEANVYNCFIYTTQVGECPPPPITGVDPDGGWVGAVLDDVKIHGTFIDGPQLAVHLELTGQSDIIATDVKFVTESLITCDFDLTDTVDGDWTLVVVNGCGTPGYYEFFNIGGCDGKDQCPTGAITGHDMGGSEYYYQSYYDHTVVHGANAEYIVSYCYREYEISPGVYNFSTGFVAITGDFNIAHGIYTPQAPTAETWHPDRYVATSTNRIYYKRTGNAPHTYTLYYIDWDETDGFGPFPNTASFPTVDPWMISRITVDENDNPILLVHQYGSNLAIMHWNGTSWNQVDVPASVVSEQGNTYYSFHDVAWNPITKNYLITSQAHSEYPGGVFTWMGTPAVYAIDTDGQLVWSDEELYSDIADSDRDFAVGCYIEQSDPECHFVAVVISGDYAPTPPQNPKAFGPRFARYNPYYGGKTTGDMDNQYYNFYRASGEVMEFSGSHYWFDSCWSGSLGRCPMPEW